MPISSKTVDEPPSNPQIPDSALGLAVLHDSQLLRANANAQAHALEHAEKSPDAFTDHCCPIYFDARTHAIPEPDPVVPCCHPDEWSLPQDGNGSCVNAPDISDKLHDLREPEDVLPLRRNDLFPSYPYGRAEEFERLRTRDPGQKFAHGLFPRHLRPLYRRFGPVYTPPATPTQQQDPTAAGESQLVVREHHLGSICSLAAYSPPPMCLIPKKSGESRRFGGEYRRSKH